MQRRTVAVWILGLALAGGAVPTVAGGIVPETLQDGTKIEIDGDKVYVIRAGDGSVKPGDGSVRAGDGSVKPGAAAKKTQRVAAEDGIYKLKSGKTIQVKGGKLVAAEPQK